MKIKKGTKLTIKHNRKGTFTGVAKEDFDTKKDEFYPIVLAQDYVEGISTSWEEGEEIPCRNTLCKVSLYKKDIKK